MARGSTAGEAGSIDDALQLRVAAAEMPHETGLIVADASGGQTRHSFAQLHAAIGGDDRDTAPRALEGSLSLACVIEHLAAIDAGAPIVALHPRWPADERARIAQRAARPLEPASATPLLAIVFTSGTSGARKGVLLSRAAFVASARASQRSLPLGPGDRWLLAMPLAHVGGLSILTRCLAARAAPVLVEGAFDAARANELLVRAEVTHASVVPTMLARMLESGAPVPATLRALLVGGARAPAELLARAIDVGYPIFTTYGLTEACSQVATSVAPLRRAQDAQSAELLPGVEARIGPRGTLLIRGPTRMEGYLDQSCSPFDAEGYYDTGDLASLEGGGLRIHGRADDLIISGGENVNPAQVERALEALPAIREACVFGVPDETWGERVEAALVCDVGHAPTDPELRDALRAHLAPFEIPKRFHRLDALPRGATGKPDRRALRAR